MPFSRPTDAGGFAEELYEQMAPLTWADENWGWALLCYLGAIGQTIESLDYLAHQDVPWEGMLNIDTVPDAALPWLGQFVGAVLDASLSSAEQRQQIRDHIGWNRGTPATFISMGKSHLTGTKTLQLDERLPTPYSFRVITWADETPEEDWPVINLISNPSFETNTTGWFVE